MSERNTIIVNLRRNTVVVGAGPRGPVGKSAYQSYLDTTADDPLLTEETWAAATGATWADITGKPPTFPPTIGSGATDAVAGNDSRLGQIVGKANLVGGNAFTGSQSFEQVTIEGALTFIDETSFVFGTASKANFLTASGAMAATGGTMTNGTISGTVAFGIGTQAAFLTALGTSQYNPAAVAITGGTIAVPVIAAGNGTAGAPSLSFSNYASSGFYTVSSNIYVAVGGFPKAYFIGNNFYQHGSGVIGFGSGTADIAISRISAGLMGVGTGAGASFAGSLKLTNLEAVGTIKAAAYTVATLPTPAAGMRAHVTDANATTFASTVAGGGANVVPVFYNGTNWIIA